MSDFYTGRLFSSVKQELMEKGISFDTQRTFPTNTKFITDDACLYVIRQQIKGNVLTLTLAAKMGKEVS